MPPDITHPDRVLWPATNHTRAVTKADLAAYYVRYAGRILAQIAGRPLSIARAPDGITGPLFPQRHSVRGQSPADRRGRDPGSTAAVPARGYRRRTDRAGANPGRRTPPVERVRRNPRHSGPPGIRPGSRPGHEFWRRRQIARPVPWTAVKSGLDPAGWHLTAMLEGTPPRDPWPDFTLAGGDLRAAIARAEDL